MHDNYLTHKAPLYIDVRDRDHMTVSVSHRPVFCVQSIKCMEKKKKKLNAQVIFKIYQRHVQKLSSFNFSSFIYTSLCPTKANASVSHWVHLHVESNHSIGVLMASLTCTINNKSTSKLVHTWYFNQVLLIWLDGCGRRELDLPSFLDQRENQRHYYSATEKLKLDPFHLVFSRHITFKILLLCTFSLPWSMAFCSSMAINLFRAESFNQIKIGLCIHLAFSHSHTIQDCIWSCGL